MLDHGDLHQYPNAWMTQQWHYPLLTQDRSRHLLKCYRHRIVLLRQELEQELANMVQEHRSIRNNLLGSFLTVQEADQLLHLNIVDYCV